MGFVAAASPVFAIPPLSDVQILQIKIKVFHAYNLKLQKVLN